MISHIDKDLQIQKLIKLLASNEKKFIFLTNIPQEKSNFILNNFIDVFVDNEKIPEWTWVSMINMDECIINVKKLILINISDDELEKNKTNSFIHKKVLAPIIRKKVEKISNAKAKYYNEDEKKSKNLFWPILNTISSFGMGLGVPLFSALLFRQEQIINGTDGKGGIGVPFFYGMIALAISLIILSLVTMIIGLANTIIKNKEEYISTLSHKKYLDILKKYFILENNNDNEKNKFNKYKFKITKKFIFFNTNGNIHSEYYSDYIKLLNVIIKMNSKVVLTFEENLSLADKRTTRNIVSNDETSIVNFEKYKDNINIKSLFNFILYQITILTGVSSRTLINHYPLFINAIYRFIDLSSSNEQLISLIKTLKRFIGFNHNVKILKQEIPYFVHLFSLSVLKSIDTVTFEQLYNNLSNKGYFSEEITKKTSFQLLRLDEVFERSFVLFQTNSLFFKFKDFFNYNINLKSMIETNQLNKHIIIDKINWIRKIKEHSLERNFDEQAPIKPFDFIFINDQKEKLAAKYIYLMSQETKIIKEIDNALLVAKENNINYVILDVYDTRLYYHLIDGFYELILDLFL